jgi:hypothetical protein
VTLFA